MSSDEDNQDFPQTVNISLVQKAEIKRFVALKLFTSDADAVRRMLENATDGIHTKYSMKPLPIKEVKA